MSVDLVVAFSKSESEQKTLNLGKKTKEERTAIEGLCRRLKLKYRSEEIYGDKTNKSVTISKPNGYIPGKKQKQRAKDDQTPMSDSGCKDGLDVEPLDTKGLDDPERLSDSPSLSTAISSMPASTVIEPSHVHLSFSKLSLDEKLTDSDKLAMLSDYRITDDVLKEFCSTSSLPVAVPTKEYITYYFDLLDSDPNYEFDAWKKFRHFFHELVTFSGYGKFAKRNESVASLVASEVRRICKDTPYKPYVPYVSKSEFKSLEANMYMRDNHNKWFVSIDIKSAWFTLFKLRYLLDEKRNISWEDFISPFTSSPYVRSSKKIREIVFGRSGFQRTVGSNYREIQDAMLDFISVYLTESGICFKPYHLGNDELIIEVDEGFDVQGLKEQMDKKFSDMFHVRKFKLVELANTGFFVKHHSTGKIEFKVCGGEFLAQCIKFYTNQPILENDRQFTNSNGVAVYRKSKFE